RNIAHAELEEAARRGVRRLLPVEQDAPGARRKKPEYGLEDGRLAGTVGADDGRDGTPPHLERNLLQDGHRPIAGDDTLELKDRQPLSVSVQDRPPSPPRCCGPPAGRLPR